MSRKPGAYVHVPFCSRVCPYCDFAVIAGGRERQARYVEHLLLELDLAPPPAEPCDTLYFGGGTPSRISPDALAKVTGALEARSWLADDCWISLEANPEDVTPESVRAWRALGVRTLSLGVQSLGDDALAFLGRRHTAADAREAFELAREAEFPVVSIDFIYSRPEQTLDTWRAELREAAALAPEHLSCYELTLHDGTLFGRRHAEGRLSETGPAAKASFFRATHETLEELGYEGYEVSNFARSKEHRSLHNQKYWDHTPYVGLGPSAHSFDGARRRWNEKRLFDWQSAISTGQAPIEGEEELSEAELFTEVVMLRLRTRDGIDLEQVRERFRVEPLTSQRELFSRSIEQGLLELDGRFLRPTLDGLAVADSLARSFAAGYDASRATA